MKAIVNSAAQTSGLKMPGREICYNQADLPYHSWEVWGSNHYTSIFTEYMDYIFSCQEEALFLISATA